MNVSETPVGELRTANHLLNDFDRLSTLYHVDGYLFFRSVLDERAVLRAKQEFASVLQQQGIARVNESEAIWTGAGLDQIDDDVLYALDGYQKLLDLESTRRFIERIFAEPVFMYQNVDIRFALPNDEKHLTPSHQDHFFIRQTERFRTVWIPLMPIERKVGGLAVAARSHHRGLLEHLEHETAYSYIFRGRKQRGVPLERIHQTWLTADYRHGDLLVFHSLMIHRALPNRSNRIRLSLDTRYQPLSEPRTWQAEKTILELRHYRRRVRDIALAEGASEQPFESVLIDMMKQGLEAKKENVRTVMEQIGQEGCSPDC